MADFGVPARHDLGVLAADLDGRARFPSDAHRTRPRLRRRLPRDAAQLQIWHGSKLRVPWTTREVPTHRVPMDNLAHALVGAAVGRALADRRIPAPALVGMVATNAPDWAELLYGLPWWSQEEYLRLHRGITHSLVGAIVETAAMVLLIGAGILLWRRRRNARTSAVPWGPLTLCIGVAVLSHLYMDWQGSYGLRPFLPWNGTWYYADWVAIVDPFFWLVPLVVLAWGA